MPDAQDVECKHQWSERLCEELRAAADTYFRSERAGHTLQATALVSEVWLRLAGGGVVETGDRNAFFALAATTIRRILVDHSRRVRAAKRGGGSRGGVLLEDQIGTPAAGLDALELDEALKELELFHPRSARVVELRFFAGMQIETIAEILGVTDRTVRNDWLIARGWLRKRLAGGQA